MLGTTLSRSTRYVAYLFLTLSPLYAFSVTQLSVPFDLHVLATPPAFVLSQDQTLQFLSLISAFRRQSASGSNSNFAHATRKPVGDIRPYFRTTEGFHTDFKASEPFACVLRCLFSRCFGWYQLLTCQRTCFFAFENFFQPARRFPDNLSRFTPIRHTGETNSGQVILIQSSPVRPENIILTRLWPPSTVFL